MVMKILYCSVCGKPYGLRSNDVVDAFTPQADKVRAKFEKMEHCDCKDEKGYE